MTTATAPAAAPPTFAGKTAAQWRAMASSSYTSAAESWERSDTDGFMSQWASGVMAGRYEHCAVVAENGGTVTEVALFLLDGQVASTHRAEGQWGTYWVLNDQAAAVVGKRFLTLSKASNSQKRYDTNKAKGVTKGRVEVAAVLDDGGVPKASVRALMTGDYLVLTTDKGVDQW